MSYSTHKGALLTRFSLEPLYKSVEQRACPIARTVLQKVLLNACGAENVTLSVSCDSVEVQEGGAREALRWPAHPGRSCGGR